MPSTKKRGGYQGFDGVKGKMTAKRIKLWTKTQSNVIGELSTLRKYAIHSSTAHSLTG